MGDPDPDLSTTQARLRSYLELLKGKLRVADALVLAGFPQRTSLRMRLVGRAMRELGWERCRYRFNGVLEYAYAKGSGLEREVVLEVQEVVLEVQNLVLHSGATTSQLVVVEKKA